MTANGSSERAQSAAQSDRPAPRVLHFVESVLNRTETFVQQRLEGDRFRPTVAGWNRVVSGLEVPCPSVILAKREWRGARSLAARATRRLMQPVYRAHQVLDVTGLLVRSNPAVVHAHFGTAGVLVAPACELLGVPLVTSFYGFDVGSLPRMAGGRGVYDRLFSAAAALTAEGPALARTLIALGAPRDKIRILPLAYPSSLLDEPEPRPHPGDDEFELLQVARFVEKKGIDITLRALALVRRAGIRARLSLVGDGPLRPTLELLIDELGLRDAVFLPGFVTQSDLGQLFARAHVYVQPSRTAPDGDTEGGHPAILVEALARGVPVVATTHADIPLVVREEVTGLLSPENDAEALARNLVRLANDRQTLAAMALAARKMTLRRHHPATVRSLQERIYREAIRSRSGKRRSLAWLPTSITSNDPFSTDEIQ